MWNVIRGPPEGTSGKSLKTAEGIPWEIVVGIAQGSPDGIFPRVHGRILAPEVIAHWILKKNPWWFRNKLSNIFYPMLLGKLGYQS